MFKVMFNFQCQKGMKFGYQFAKLLLYFVESAAALNEFVYSLLK